MAIATLLAFFIVSHLVLLHSVESHLVCPPSFECKKVGTFGFPFTNSTYPGCGFMVQYCDEDPVVQLKEEGPWYAVTDVNHDTIEIHDQQLQRHLTNKNCDDTFNNLTLPKLPFISFIISHNHTFFKCPNPPQFTPPDYKIFNCSGYSVYNRSPPHDGELIPDGLLHHCSAIQLPVVRTTTSQSVDNPFQLLAFNFYLKLLVSSACLDCHGKIGQCLNAGNEFKCVVPKQGILAGVVLLVAVLLLCCFGRRWSLVISRIFSKKEREKYQQIELFLKNYGSLASKRYSYSDVKKMTNSFAYKLGQGGYGVVYKGKLQNGHLVAVKVLTDSKGNGEEFTNEVASISKTSHVNVVTLLGFCFEGTKRTLIYEFMPNGSLEKFIYDESSSLKRQLGWETLYQIAAGIARGLEYLHRGCNTRILHFDIKPHNILLDEDFCPKISDFGLSKLCSKKDSIISMLGARGTAGYIAPEVFSRSFGGVSHKSDVYSYEIMVLEMVGGRKNIDVGVDHTSEIYFPHWIYKRVELDEDLGLYGIMNEEQNERVRKMIIVGLWCIQIDPSNRPSISKVMEMLEGSLEFLQIPPKPILSSPPRPPADSSNTQIL